MIHSHKSIFTQQKSIIPLFSSGLGCYNTSISSAAGKRFCCKTEMIKFQKRNIRTMIYGGIAMKKNVKQLLVNAMEEYGNNLILSDRFWSLTQPAPCGRKIKITNKESETWKAKWLRKKCWKAWKLTVSFWAGCVPDPQKLWILGGT